MFAKPLSENEFVRPEHVKIDPGVADNFNRFRIAVGFMQRGGLVNDSRGAQWWIFVEPRQCVFFICGSTHNCFRAQTKFTFSGPTVRVLEKFVNLVKGDARAAGLSAQPHYDFRRKFGATLARQSDRGFPLFVPGGVERLFVERLVLFAQYVGGRWRCDQDVTCGKRCSDIKKTGQAFAFLLFSRFYFKGIFHCAFYTSHHAANNVLQSCEVDVVGLLPQRVHRFMV